MQCAKEILDYWFGPPESPDFGERRDIWFKDGRTIDAEVRERFLTHHEAAAGGAFEHWREDPRACLALILLFDQFPRHMFRDQPRAYATDPLALAVAKHALEAGHHRDRPVVELTFFHLPFEHAEDLVEQRRSLALRQAMPEHDGKEKSIQHAIEHLEVVERFGRFPHRNEILGRESTPEEISFLEENPDAWFVKYRKRPRPSAEPS